MLAQKASLLDLPGTDSYSKISPFSSCLWISSPSWSLWYFNVLNCKKEIKHTQKFWQSHIIISRHIHRDGRAQRWTQRLAKSVDEHFCPYLRIVENRCSWRHIWTSSTAPPIVRPSVYRAFRLCITHILSFPRFLMSVKWPPLAAVPVPVSARRSGCYASNKKETTMSQGLPLPFF